MRQVGYYWVQTDNEEWHVAEWSGMCWLLTGTRELFYDDEFISIENEPIKIPQS